MRRPGRPRGASIPVTSTASGRGTASGGGTASGVKRDRAQLEALSGHGVGSPVGLLLVTEPQLC